MYGNTEVPWHVRALIDALQERGLLTDEQAAKVRERMQEAANVEGDEWIAAMSR